MNDGQRKVTIKLKTTINDQGQIETTKTEQSGTLFRHRSRDVLLFDEITGDGRKISNFITLQSDKVSIKRSGAVSMHQQFMVGQRSETMYEHSHGTIHLETDTKRLTYDPSATQCRGRLEIDYTGLLNSDIERQHTLVLTYQEEDYS